MRRLCANLFTLLIVLALVPGARAASTARCADPDVATKQPSKLVARPTITGPIGAVGIRTQKPYLTTIVPLKKGWVEREFFLEGTARSYSSAGTGALPVEAPYKTRIVVRRPTDPAEFNGTVVVDWNNVTVPHDKELQWAPLHPTFMRRGFMYVSVAAQMVGVEGGPLSLKFYDPVRYGSLSHPGDDYSFDIFSQAAQAVLDPRVSGAPRPCIERLIAMGASQSGGRLLTYINTVHEHARLFDGFQPQISGAGSVRRDLVPVVWVNSTAEVGDTDIAADSKLFRLWELAGPSHSTQNRQSYEDEALLYSQSNGLAGGNWNADEGRSWGYRAAPGDCLRRNYFDVSYQWAAALVALDDWLRTGKAPRPMPRARRDANGRVYDQHDNLAGGVRSPLVDVPIATYYAGLAGPAGTTDPCGVVGSNYPLYGTTKVFDAPTLAKLYPTPETYLKKFDAAVNAAVAAGSLLREDVPEIRRRARDAAKWLAEAT
jgi:hypothetical protein